MGGVFLLFASFLALFAYVLAPDRSSHANQQDLRLIALSPGSKVQVVVFEVEAGATTPFWQKLVGGEAQPAAFFPVQEVQINSDSLYFQPYTRTKTAGAAWEALPLKTAEGRYYHETRRYWLGTDVMGRDLLSRLLLGLRVSLSVGFIAVLISIAVGASLGAIAGYYRGWVDQLIGWLINVIWSIPSLLLVIAFSLALGKGMWQVFLAVGLTMWVDVARIVRGRVLSLREQEFVTAARAMDFSDVRIIFRHLLPNVVGPIVIMAASNFATAILVESGLSFLGLGLQPPAASLGMMIKEHYPYIIMDAAYLALVPGLVILLLVLAFNLLGNGLSDAFDSKVKMM
jgi:peptide/nickel transport system permease protein